MALRAAPDLEQRDGAVTETGAGPTAPDTAADPATDTAPAPATARRSAAVRWTVLAVLVVLLLGSLGYLGVRVASDGTGSGWHRVTSAFSADDPLQDERDAIMSQSRQFALRLNTYGPDQLDSSGAMPKYQQLVEQVITPKYRTDFEKSGMPLVQATVSQLGVKRTAQVYATGVAAIGDGTATALVAGDFTISYPKKKGSSDYVANPPQPFRLEVKLVETGGTWLVDSFAPVESAQNGSGQNGSGQSGSSGSGATDGSGQ